MKRVRYAPLLILACLVQFETLVDLDRCRLCSP